MSQLERERRGPASASILDRSGMRFGRVVIDQDRIEVPVPPRPRLSLDYLLERALRIMRVSGPQKERLTEDEAIAVAAFELRATESYRRAKAQRPSVGVSWGIEGTNSAPDLPPPPPGDPVPAGSPGPEEEDLSAFLIGSVALHVIVVQGPTPDLRISTEEREFLVAELQEAIVRLVAIEPAAKVFYVVTTETVELDVAVDPALTGYPALEAHWRDAALRQLGYPQGRSGVYDMVVEQRRLAGARWGYALFVTRYPVHHFGYAVKPYVVIHYDNGRWQPVNIDQVFQHETGHIFCAPDEYREAPCACNERFGVLQEVNGNCEGCPHPEQPFSPCLMSHNVFAICPYTRVHLGYRDSNNDGVLDPDD